MFISNQRDDLSFQISVTTLPKSAIGAMYLVAATYKHPHTYLEGADLRRAAGGQLGPLGVGGRDGERLVHREVHPPDLRVHMRVRTAVLRSQRWCAKMLHATASRYVHVGLRRCDHHQCRHTTIGIAHSERVNRLIKSKKTSKAPRDLRPEHVPHGSQHVCSN